MQNCDFLLEFRLKKINRDLAQRYTCCMSVFDRMLEKFFAVFPTFTDHTLLHSMNVTDITNKLLRDRVESLSAEEIYIYLMASALHDIGMGVSERDLGGFIDSLGLNEYVEANPQLSKPELIRIFHNDFSAAFIKKYWAVLEIPDERYAHAIAEVGRGHRKTDLFDRELYPTDYDLGDGGRANLAFLAALIRLCDELDIAANRNLGIQFNVKELEGRTEQDLIEFYKHEAIHTVTFTEDTILVTADTERSNVAVGVIEKMKIVKKTFDYCLSVMNECSDIKIDCQKIKLVLNGKEEAV